MRTEGLSPARLEAFFDAVIAVILTIMVLELKVPVQDGLAEGLRRTANAHPVPPLLRPGGQSVAHSMLWANFIFLFCLSLFPLAAAPGGEKHLSPCSTALYSVLSSVVSLLPGFTYPLFSCPCDAARPFRRTRTCSG